MTKEAVRLHARVYGRVQGVNFRYHTQKKANALGVGGWVANRSDGTVEVVAEGEKAELQKLVSFLHRGSPSARVERVNVDWDEATLDETARNRFRVRYL
jgi:acylphosphatase